MPSAARAAELIGAREARATAVSLVGDWIATVGGATMRLGLSADGRFTLDGEEGEYSAEGKTLKLRSGETEVTYEFKLTGNTLALSGGDLANEMSFTRQPGLSGFLGWLFDISYDTTMRRAYRILFIVGVAVLARVLIALLRALSYGAIFWEWGPLRYFYRRDKNRALTIHRLLLNVLKYAVYLVTLGVVLSELGINYVAYVASLSVVGLAIGFGSQGLVRDMVTGLFVIVEGQFEVGDMVAISGQTGVVEELGLRMTKIRTYRGQLVVIPNRNISVVANYTRGGLDAFVDVAVTNAEAARPAGGAAERIAAEIARQFDGAILSPPELLGSLSLATGETFVRLNVLVWPGQEWVVDRELVPRLRDGLKDAGIDIPGGRVTVSYRRGEEKEEASPAWRRHLEKLRRRFTGGEGKT